jgi:P-type Ca2+ transporter type 2C
VEVIGDPTEGALLVAAAKAGLDADTEAARSPRIAEHPFDAQRKRMSTLHREGEHVVLRCKGAPRELLERCTFPRTPAGTDRSTMTPRAAPGRKRRPVARAMRVLGVACPHAPIGRGRCAPDEVERDLTWLGMVGMLDPPREAVADAIATCHRAGIRILMITGDYGVTAESIARRVGSVAPTRTCGSSTATSSTASTRTTCARSSPGP